MTTGLNIPQGSDAKKREQVSEHWRLEALRNGCDQVALEQVRQRALNASDVRSDPMMQGVIEQIVRDRAIAIASARGTRQPTTEARDKTARIGLDRSIAKATAVAECIKHLRIQAEDQLVSQDEVAAGFTLARLRAIRTENRGCIDDSMMASYERRLESLRQRRLDHRRRIEQFANRAIEAARTGRHDEVSRLLRKLSAHHVAHPDIVTDEDLLRIRRQVGEAGLCIEHRRAARELIRREREITKELRSLGLAINEFRNTATRADHRGAEYRQAFARYRQALIQLKHHDLEWLSGTILEIVSLLDDWEKHPDSAERQVESFVRWMKQLLHELYKAARSAERERKKMK